VTSISKKITRGQFSRLEAGKSPDFLQNSRICSCFWHCEEEPIVRKNIPEKLNHKEPVNLAFDIDDTITAKPALFAALSCAAGVKKVLIVSSRGNSEESRRLTLEELKSIGIRHHGLHLLDDGPEARNRCPHPDLDWYQRYLWQKVEICLREKIDIIFEDDPKVIDLFRRFAPKILVMQVHRTARTEES
jgi:hypothetical protein